MRDRFRAAGIASPERDARLLAEHCLGLAGVALVSAERDPIPAEMQVALDALAQRRLGGEPVARILGERGFYGLDFALVPATLVPRPETEMLVDHALSVLDPAKPCRVLDLGTGTGCIAIAILAQLPLAEAVAIDISAEALACATANAARHRVGDRFEARAGSWYAPLAAGERFALIVSNPPYIESADIAGLMVEVRAHDPLGALDGGADGLDAYRIIAQGAAAHLRDGGEIALEIGARQGVAVSRLLAEAGLQEVVVQTDFAGLDRVVIGHQF